MHLISLVNWQNYYWDSIWFELRVRRYHRRYYGDCIWILFFDPSSVNMNTYSEFCSNAESFELYDPYSIGQSWNGWARKTNNPLKSIRQSTMMLLQRAPSTNADSTSLSIYICWSAETFDIPLHMVCCQIREKIKILWPQKIQFDPASAHKFRFGLDSPYQWVHFG